MGSILCVPQQLERDQPIYIQLDPLEMRRSAEEETETSDDFATIEDEQDGIRLFNLFRSICNRREDGKKCPAEIKDEKLYDQGHNMAEADFCPICFLVIPIALGDAPINRYSVLYIYCMKKVCKGSCHAAFKQGLGTTRPFCRTPDAKKQ